MKKICSLRFFRKFAVVLAFSFLTYSYCLPQGGVIAYATGQRFDFNLNPLDAFPCDVQLGMLTHVIAMGIGCNAGGTLHTLNLPAFWHGGIPDIDWNGQTNRWLESLVNRAHNLNKKAIICVGGDYFVSATNSANLDIFVANVKRFVDVHGFDGVNINWEYPANESQWNQCVNLLNALKTALKCKHISMSLSSRRPNGYPNLSIPQNIWSAVDAIFFMTYDNADWTPHSNANSSNSVVYDWAFWWGNPPPIHLDKSKLFVGSAFFGWDPVVGEENGGSKIPYKEYWIFPFSRGDNMGDAISKVSVNYDREHGGIMIYELSFDFDPNNANSLLNAISTTNNNKGGYIQPCAAPTLTYTTSPGPGVTTVNNGCGNIVIQNVIVNNGVTLNFINNCGIITVNNVTVFSGGKLMLDGGEVIINEIDVRLGADFEIR